MNVDCPNHRTACSCRLLSLQQCQCFGREERRKDREVPKEHEKHLLLLCPVTQHMDPPGNWTFWSAFHHLSETLGVSLLQSAADTQLFLSSAADVLSRYP